MSVSLAPGNYIVRVDQDNFDNTGGGDTLTALVPTQVSSTTVPDPPDPDLGPDGAIGGGDDDRDNDDNGSRAIGQPAFSKAITLAYNTEPTSDGGVPPANDVNTTLDFGFLNNPPPVIALLTYTSSAP